MTFLPIVTRELRVASRRRSTYWVRTGAGLAVVMAGVWLFLMVQGQSAREIGRFLFWVLTGSAVVFALLSGLRATADCLSEEKREGTLGLLFLTDLKGYDIVLGKLVATSLNAFYSVLAVMPMLAVPLLLGGVTAGEYARIALVTLNTLFFSLSIGICVSAVSRSAQKAIGLTALLILFWTVVAPAAGSILAAVSKTSPVEPWFLLPSPGYNYFMALDLSPKPPAGLEGFWCSTLVIQVLSWLCLILASIIAPRSWQEKPEGPMVRWRERWRSWTFGSVAERVGFRRRLLDQSPFFWLASRGRLRPAGVWVFLVVVAGIWVWGLVKLRREWLNEVVYFLTALFLNSAFKCWFAVEASRQMAEERKAGTLELLLSTPLAVRDILRGQLLTLNRQFLGPVVAILVVQCLFMAAPLSESFTAEERGLWLALFAGGMVMLVADLAALYWVGMWQGLTARNPTRAATTSVLAILCAPWVVFALVVLLMGLAALSGVPEREPGPRFFLGLWLIQGLGADLVFGAYARHKLLTEFRFAAQERYTTSGGVWKRWLGGQGWQPETRAPLD
jgi:ABC-type transport system involved in multi-copper enzyme maturation permease subunit